MVAGIKRKAVGDQSNTIMDYNKSVKWTCEQCTYINTASAATTKHKCSMCDHKQTIEQHNSTKPGSVKHEPIVVADEPIVLDDTDVTVPIDTSDDTKPLPPSNSTTASTVHDKTTFELSKPVQISSDIGDDALYYTDFITPAEHDHLITELDKYEWIYADGKVRPRRMQLWGIFADKTGCGYYKGINAPNAFPTCLKPILDRLINCGIYNYNDAPTTMIIQEYRTTVHGAESLGQHIDNPFFGNTVADISLLQPCILRWNQTNMPNSYNTVEQYIKFHKDAYKQYGGYHGSYITKGGKQFDVTLEPDSLLVFKDTARWKWLHGVPSLKRGRPNGTNHRRVSLTIRTLFGKQTSFDQIKFLDPPTQSSNVQNE